ncbi:hypothetical protein FGO68_gene7293 [Halteria grandinella]|uniref:Uncharacterized protein n=1 Tax=Halteria grandinella TaxID=5974 RepID=A0A8J8P3L9_HALGN|nr:hypothetical protein FGO68_gene7293 [Halteria grandinella]
MSDSLTTSNLLRYLIQQGSEGGTYANQTSQQNETKYWEEAWNYFKEGGEQSCQLLGSLGIVLQSLLFIISFSSLLIKRKLDAPKGQPPRSWTIFFMDISKQVFSSGLLHLYNILAARALSEEGMRKNGSDSQQCEWYFVNFTLDIMGIAAFSYLQIMLLNRVMIANGYQPVVMGQYTEVQSNNRNQLDSNTRRTWFYQLCIWLAIVSISKFCILIIIFAFKEPILYAAILILFPIQKYPRLLLLVVMVLVPLAFNTLQFWIIDEFLRYKQKDAAHKQRSHKRAKNSSDSYETDSGCSDDDEVSRLMKDEAVEARMSEFDRSTPEVMKDKEMEEGGEQTGEQQHPLSARRLRKHIRLL